MPKLGLGVTASQTSTLLLPPSSQYTGTNALLSTRLSDLPGATALVETFNCNDAGFYTNDGFPLPITGWKNYSPTFTNIVDYKSLAPKYFLNAYPPYSLEDGPAGRHLIKEFGIGSTLISFNNDFNRGDPDPPMRQITSTPTTPGTTTTDWVKYEMYQVVNIPVEATVVNFGAMVLCPANDDLRPYNFGGLYIFAGDETSDKWSVDFSAICGSSVPTLPGSQAPGTYINYLTASSYSRFMWAGPDLAFGNRVNDSLYLRGNNVFPGGASTTQELASNYRTWKQLNVRVPLPLGGSGSGVDNTKLGFSMYFAESRGYLTAPGVPSTVPTGSIWFYDPYVVFS